MDLTSPRCFQAPIFTSSSNEPPLESNSSLYDSTKSKSNPFVETAEFVKSLPTSNIINNERYNRSNYLDSSAQRREGVTSVVTHHKKVLEAPPTPGRPVFSFSVGSNQLSRKSFPSKWDDAEKWLINSSCQDSPAHNNNNTMKVGNAKQCENFKQHQMEVAKGAAMFQRSASLNNQNSCGKGFMGGLGSMDVLPKDKFVDDIEPIRPNLKYLEPTREGFLFGNPACEIIKDAGTDQCHPIEHRDIGTEMTPLGSSTTSRCHTPFKYPSPARHNTPENRSGPLAYRHTSSANSTIDIAQLQECHLAKLQLGTQYDSVASAWNSREDEEKEISKSLRHYDTGDVYAGNVYAGNEYRECMSEPRSAAWEEDEDNKCCLRYQREEAKIQAWINLQSAKAEAQSRKLEVKIQKMRSNLEEKLMRKMANVHRKAEEFRAEARQQHTEQIHNATNQAQKMISRHHPHFSGHIYCGCFPCSNHKRS